MSYTTNFHPFSRLPPELRQQIWRCALPEALRPTIFFHKSDLWQKDPSPPEDHGNPYASYYNKYFIFHDQLLDPVQLNIPIAGVTYEAFDVVLEWVKKHGVQVVKSSNTDGLIACGFNAERDGLYIGHLTLKGLLSECSYRRERYDPDSLANEEVMSKCDIKHVALPARTLIESGEAKLQYVLSDYFPHVEEIWLVHKAQPTDRMLKIGSEHAHQQWTIIDIEDDESVKLVTAGLRTYVMSYYVHDIQVRAVETVRAY